MKPHRTFDLPETVVKEIGEEWRGKYTVHLLNAREYLTVAEEMVQELRESKEWNGQISDIDLRYRITVKAVTLNNKPLDAKKEIPSKLYEMLSMFALPLNTLSVKEGQDLFLASSTAKKPESEQS